MALHGGKDILQLHMWLLFSITDPFVTVLVERLNGKGRRGGGGGIMSVCVNVYSCGYSYRSSNNCNYVMVVGPAPDGRTDTQSCRIWWYGEEQ